MAGCKIATQDLGDTLYISKELLLSLEWAYATRPESCISHCCLCDCLHSSSRSWLTTATAAQASCRQLPWRCCSVVLWHEYSHPFKKLEMWLLSQHTLLHLSLMRSL